jgi:ABC-type dipeptide/oligopeptide/nickel transport system permease component
MVGVLAAVQLVSLVAYAALTFAPGDPAQALLGERASAEQVATLRRQMRLDEPLLERYGEYIAGALTRGDLGQSLVSGREVADLIGERLPATLTLAFVAMGLATFVGLGLGLAAATRPGSRLDLLVMGGASLGLALPSYWVGPLLVLVFSSSLHLLPVHGAGTPAHLVLPAVTLALPAVAMVARMVRASLLEAGSADFVRTARAKGLTVRRTLLRHVLPNSLVPTLTLLGLNLGHLIGGAFVVETIFAWPGLGRLTVQAIFDRDVPVVMGAVLVAAPLCLTINLIVDLLQSALDPRLHAEVL